MTFNHSIEVRVVLSPLLFLIFFMEKLRVIQGESVASVIREANELGVTKDDYLQIIVNNDSVILIYYV